MCEINVGQLIICFSRFDPAARALLGMIREHGIEHVSHRESMEQKLARAKLTMDSNLEFEMHLLEVPPGQENWKINFLQFFYKHKLVETMNQLTADKKAMAAFNRSDCHFTVIPNHLMSLSQTNPAGSAVSAKTFQFGPLYATYKRTVGFPVPVRGSAERVRITVVDSGIASDAGGQMHFKIVSEHNLLDLQNSQKATDEHGHGTAVTLLIDDLVPNAEFVIVKVADKEGMITEWDALAGIVAKTDAQVVNLSMQFGLLPKPACAVCHRKPESTASRSAVFENIIQGVLDGPKKPIVVAAAGNAQLSELAYPARFGNALAIGALTSGKTLSSDSNYGDVDQTGAEHLNHYVLPGGEIDPQKSEDILVSGGGRSWCGTSFAAAIGTAVVSSRISLRGYQNYNRDTFLDDLRKNADKNLPNYSNIKHGKGIMKV